MQGRVEFEPDMTSIEPQGSAMIVAYHTYK